MNVTTVHIINTTTTAPTAATITINASLLFGDEKIGELFDVDTDGGGGGPNDVAVVVNDDGVG